MKRTVSGFLGGLFKSRRKATPEAPRMVWRISDSEPRGAWVDPLAPEPPPLERPTAARSSGAESSGWLTSSMDLLGGAEIVEHGDSAVPDIFPETAAPPRSGLRHEP